MDQDDISLMERVLLKLAVTDDENLEKVRILPTMTHLHLFQTIYCILQHTNLMYSPKVVSTFLVPCLAKLKNSDNAVRQKVSACTVFYFLFFPLVSFHYLQCSVSW